MMKVKMAELSVICPKFEETFSFLGKKWMGLIIDVLLDGPKRFKDLAESIPNVSDRVLVERLKELEERELVDRTVYPETPVRVEYSLTEKGRDLEKAMGEVKTWGEKWL